MSPERAERLRWRWLWASIPFAIAWILTSRAGLPLLPLTLGPAVYGQGRFVYLTGWLACDRERP